MTTCDVCGKSLVFTNPVTGEDVVFIALQVGAYSESPLFEELADEIMKPYKPGTYNICHSCLLHALGVVKLEPSLDPLDAEAKDGQ